MNLPQNAQSCLSSWNSLIAETIRHFASHHSKDDFVNNFNMPEWLAEHNVDTWSNSGIEDLRDRAAWQLLEKIDNDKLVSYLDYLANDRKWFGDTTRSLANKLIGKHA